MSAINNTMNFKEYINDLILELEIPTVEKNSEILNIKFNENPIKIKLKDGTQLFLSIDEYRRLKKEPKKGDKVTVTFQRNPNDKLDVPSKISKFIIH